MTMSIWCGTHQMRSTRNSTTCSRRVTTPWWHPVILFLPSVDTNMSLARQIVVTPLNASKKWAIRFKMLSAKCYRQCVARTLGWRLGADWTRHRWRRCECACRRTNCYDACCHPRQWKMPRPTSAATNLWYCSSSWRPTYWPTLWSLMSPNLCTLKHSLAQQQSIKTTCHTQHSRSPRKNVCYLGCRLCTSHCPHRAWRASSHCASKQSSSLLSGGSTPSSCGGPPHPRHRPHQHKPRFDRRRGKIAPWWWRQWLEMR